MPVVTISRQVGARGTEIAQRVAYLLGYDLVDKELISQVARAAEVPEEVVRKFDETAENSVKSFLRDLLTPKEPGVRTSMPLSSFAWAMDFPYELPSLFTPLETAEASEEVHFLDQHDCLRFIQQTVQHLWRRGNVVIVGRGSQRILTGLEDTLHVRLMASEEARAERLMAANQCDFRAAMDLVRQSDRRRSRYLKRFYHVDWDDPTLYHLTINTEQTGVDMAAEMVAAGAGSLSSRAKGSNQ